MKFPQGQHYKNATAKKNFTNYRKESTKESIKIPLLIFTIIFPSFILYQTLVQLGYILPVLGGYYTASMLVSSPLIIYCYKKARFLKFGPSEICFGLFLILFGICIKIGETKGVVSEISQSNYAYLFKFICLFLLSSIMPWASPRFQKYCRLLLIALSILIFTLAADGRYLASDANTLKEDIGQINYQGLAWAYLVIYLGAVLGCGVVWRAVLHGLAFLSLFFIGARSEFVAFGVMALLIEVISARQKWLFLIKAAGTLLLLFSVFTFVSGKFMNNRMAGLLELDEDESVIVRRETRANAVETIKSSPLWGDYASYPPGGYAHNILSAWVDLGLAGFILIILVIIIPIFGLISNKNKHKDALYSACVIAFSVTTLLLLFAKTYHYQMIPVALGVYHRFTNKATRTISCPSVQAWA